MALDQCLEQLDVITPGRGFIRLNERLNNWIAGTGMKQGMLHLTCLHTSASLTINENADPQVLEDLQNWMDAVVPQDGSGPMGPDGHRRRYRHDDEGCDDMPAHIRTALTSQTLSLSIDQGRLLLGTWQGVYLWEHRSAPHTRRVACHAIGARGPIAWMQRQHRSGRVRQRCCNAATATSSTPWCSPAMTRMPGPPMVVLTPMWTCWWTVCTTSRRRTELPPGSRQGSTALWPPND